MDDLERSKLIPTSDKLAEQLEAFLDEHEAVLIEDVPATATTPTELVWRLREDAELMYVEDHLVGSTYVVFTGRNLLDVVHDFTSKIPCWDLELIHQRWNEESSAADAASRAALILAMGVLGPEQPRDDIAGIIRSSLEDTAPEVRRAAVLASAFLRWPDLLTALSRRRIVELHPDVQTALDLVS